MEIDTSLWEILFKIYDLFICRYKQSPEVTFFL